MDVIGNEVPAVSGGWPKVKRCTVLIFVGLPHHARKLKQVGELLSEAGMQIVYVTSRNIPSLGEGNAECFEFGLWRQGVPYRHLFEYRTRESVREVERRLSEVERQVAQAGRAAVAKLFEKTNRGWFSLAVRDAVECDVLFTVAIEREGADLVIGLHEANFWVKLLAHRAHMQGIPSLTLQEGHYSRDEVDRLKYWVMAEFSHVALWGAEAREAILAQAPGVAHRLHVVGDPQYDWVGDYEGDGLEQAAAEARQRLSIDTRERVLGLFMPSPYERYASAIPVVEIAEAVKAVADVRVVVKWHPREDHATIHRLAAQTQGTHVEHVTAQPPRPHDWILASDACIVLDSSTGVDALVLGRSLIEVNMGGDPFGRSYSRSGVALSITAPEQLSLISDVLLGYQSTWTEEARTRFLGRVYRRLDGRAGERIVGLASQLIAQARGANRLP